MKSFWGLVLVMFGLGYLGAGLGWWSSEVPNSLWQFWPLIFVFWGLDLLTKNTGFYVPVMIIALILSGGFIYVSLYNQSNNSNWGWNAKTVMPSKSNISAAVPSGSDQLTAKIETGAVDFAIKGETDQILAGDLTSNFAKPDVSVSSEGKTGVAKLSTVSSETNDWHIFGRNFKNELKLALNNKLPIALDIHSGAAKMDFDLTKYLISGLNLDSGASSIVIKFGEQIQDKAVVNLQTGASSIDLEFPEAVGVKITAETGLSSKTFSGYTEKDGQWYSANYDQKAKHVELKIKAGASSINVK